VFELAKIGVPGSVLIGGYDRLTEMSPGPVRPTTATTPRRGWRAFAAMFGWRAYALPALALITVAVLLHGTGSAAKRPAQHPPTSGGKVQVEGLTARDANFRAASTPKPITVRLGPDVTTCAQNGYRKLVLVSISKQQLWACRGHRQVNQTAITTGKVIGGDQTPVGSWRVQGKQRNRYLVGPGYRDYVHFWVPFNGDFGLHDASWQTMPFGSPHWRTHGSHGCVHVPTPTMAWLYHWARVGSTVVTIEH
jgi:lipoprotein-anchoring transpeptidase ErfK/SrfK